MTHIHSLSGSLFVGPIEPAIPLPFPKMHEFWKWRGERVKVDSTQIEAYFEMQSQSAAPVSAQDWDEQHNWDALDRRRIELILKNVDNSATSAEEEELARLQELADERLAHVAPLPLEELKAYQDELKAQDLWNLP